MSRTTLLDALKTFDLERVRTILKAKPELRQFQDDKGFNLLQICCRRFTGDHPAAADRQLRLARWLVSEGFDPRILYTTAPGEDGEEEPADISLVFFAVARAQNNRLARYFLQQGAKPGAFFAAAWWGNADLIEDMVRHGADINEVVGATPLHMAVDVVQPIPTLRPATAPRRCTPHCRRSTSRRSGFSCSTAPIPTSRARTAVRFARSRRGSGISDTSCNLARDRLDRMRHARPRDFTAVLPSAVRPFATRR